MSRATAAYSNEKATWHLDKILQLHRTDGEQNQPLETPVGAFFAIWTHP
jgi:hypothetical protein